MAQTLILATSETWALIPGTSAVVTLSPNGRAIDMRVATTVDTSTPPGAGINGHLLPSHAVLFQRAAGEGLWVREIGSGGGLCYTEGA
jgi:hypothetical protein